MWLIRHGDTDWSGDGRHTSRTDLPLIEQGRVHAAEVGRLVAGARSQPFALVLSSPMRRALETCRLAGFADPELTGDLLEWDYGEYEGRTTEEIRAERPGWSLFTDGVPGGETAAEVGRRADRVIARARSLQGDVLCVAHGHLLRVMAARWVGLPPAAGRLLGLETATLSVLGWEREVPVIERWNEPPPPS